MNVYLVEKKGSFLLKHALKQVFKYKPKDFCQFKTILTFSLLSNLLVKSKAIVGGKKKRPKRQTNKKQRKFKKTRKVGGTQSDDEIVNHLFTIFSSVGSFQNYLGTCVINSLVVVQAIDSKDTEQIYYAYLSKIHDKSFGLSTEQMTPILNPDTSVFWNAKWLMYDNIKFMSSLDCILLMESTLDLIRKKQNVSNLLTILNYTINNKSSHSTALWYTESKNVVLIDLQDTVKEKKFILYCENTNDKYLQSKGFLLKSLHDYIYYNLQLETSPLISLEFFQSAIFSVKNYFGRQMSTSETERVQNLLKNEEEDDEENEEDSSVELTPSAEAMPSTPRGKMNTIHLLNNTFKDYYNAIHEIDKNKTEIYKIIDADAAKNSGMSSKVEHFKKLIEEFETFIKNVKKNPDQTDNAKFNNLKRNIEHAASTFTYFFDNFLAKYFKGYREILYTQASLNTIKRDIKDKLHQEQKLQNADEGSSEYVFNAVMNDIQERKSKRKFEYESPNKRVKMNESSELDDGNEEEEEEEEE